MMVDSLSAHKGSRKAEVEEYGYALMYRSMRPSQRKIRPLLVKSIPSASPRRSDRSNLRRERDLAELVVPPALPPRERSCRLSFPAEHQVGRLPLGALPADRGARSDLAGQRVRWSYRSLRSGLQVIGGATASLTLSFDGSGDQPGHATRVHA